MSSQSNNNGLYDAFGRRIEYVRLSVTDRCDLRCVYCLPKGFKSFEEPEHWLNADEIQRLIGAFGRLGVNRIRITGGEPLLRKNLPQLAQQLSALPGIDDLSLSTNAVQLQRHAHALKQANVSRINVSLDSLQPERFKTITNGGKLEKVMAGLMAAKEAGFKPIKINMVVMRGVNDDEIEAMVDFCIAHDFTLRFIETMPIGNTGQNATDHYISLEQVQARLEQKYRLLPSVMNGGGPARYVRVADTELRIGFITPISQHFCDSCNRVRLSAEGTLYLCLGQNDKVELRPLLRSGASDTDIEQAIVDAIRRKPEKHEFVEKPQQVVRFMSMTGG
ncbi:MAG: GTP 3',8-cyclase MoaA [Gammaproteobacteria bacterium]|nr:GTP 3',8-cyclase MoaA [Gammaproteobacteria bacterium]MDH5799908.1 GTP 3',8-cyclase MoaA [Gammaproteobacteria bacterium]